MRESEHRWQELFAHLRDRQGLSQPKPLAIGDGALGFCRAPAKIATQATDEHCSVQKASNVPNKLPKSLLDKADLGLHAIQMAETRACASRNTILS